MVMSAFFRAAAMVNLPGKLFIPPFVWRPTHAWRRPPETLKRRVSTGEIVFVDFFDGSRENIAPAYSGEPSLFPERPGKQSFLFTFI